MQQTWWRRLADSRPPDLIIGDDYLWRWYVIPRNPIFNIYLHNFKHSDDDRALHDHPWFNFSYLLEGGYLEWSIAAGGIHKAVNRHAGDWKFRGPRSAHRIELRDHSECWTLFITGPRMREWGFHCQKGWRRWQDFTAGARGEKIGRGCGEGMPAQAERTTEPHKHFDERMHLGIKDMPSYRGTLRPLAIPDPKGQ